MLPPWCSANPRLFVLIHRQALESEYVRENISSWLDLVFGVKQRGEAAVKAINVFHPAVSIGVKAINVVHPAVSIGVKAINVFHPAVSIGVITVGTSQCCRNCGFFHLLVY